MKTIYPLVEHLRLLKESLVRAFTEKTMNDSNCPETMQILEENCAYWERMIAQLQKEIDEYRAEFDRGEGMNPPLVTRKDLKS